MIILNFAHPLMPEQLETVETITGNSIRDVIEVASHFDLEQPFKEQVLALLNQIPLNPHQWETESILIQPPSLNFITAVLLAELHGRMGYFPTILRMRPIPGTTPTKFEVAEIINLHEVREEARKRRFSV